MGEYADMILNGSMCQACGVFFKSEPGYPRVCRSCAAELEIKDAIIAEDEV